MKNWLGLFLNPQGRIGRRSFWHGWLVLTVLNLALVLLTPLFKAAPFGFQPAFALPLITLYPTSCLYVKRLHDLDRPGWLEVPPRIGWAIGLAFLATPRLWQTTNAWLLIPYALTVVALVWDVVLLWLAGAAPAAIAQDPAAVFD